jgi:hypothetical protein
MNSGQLFHGIFRLTFLFLLGMSLSGCSWFRQHGVQVSITNESGIAVHNLEFDFPGGSFGVSSIPSGGNVVRWFNPNASGDLTITFLDSNGRHESKFPHALSRVSGTMALQIVSGGKVIVETMQAQPSG